LWMKGNLSRGTGMSVPPFQTAHDVSKTKDCLQSKQALIELSFLPINNMI
jgi:hypothetical protein